jgi:DNA mismatch repair protein MutL
MMHAISEAYRNVIPPTSFPVVLLFLELPPEEVDVNVHPAKTEVRFRQQSLMHDFVRDSLRTALIKARPAAGFLAAAAAPAASSSLMPPGVTPLPGSPEEKSGELKRAEESDPLIGAEEGEPFQLTPRMPTPVTGRLAFTATEAGTESWQDQPAWGEALVSMLVSDKVQRTGDGTLGPADVPGFGGCSPSPNGARLAEMAAATTAATELVEAERASRNLNHLGNLRPLGQLRESFILAAGDDGLWIIDQHVAHERVLFEKILRDRLVERVQRQRFLMPLLVELKPWQMVIFAQIAEELEKNGFEVEPFGPQTLAVKAAPVGLEGAALERMLNEVIEQSSAVSEEPTRNEDLATLRSRVAASIACHSAIKVNTALDPVRMEWLLLELAKTNHPTSCPHGRPIALLYSWKEIQRAFHRI